MPRLILSLLTLLSAASVAAAQTGRGALVRTLDSIASAPVKEGRAVGLGIAVVRGSDTLLLKGYGRAEVDWNVPMADDAVFEIGSITKQFTAAAILQLRDAGKLSLDDDITKYVPDWTPAHRLTIRRMLDHTGGIRGLTELPEFGRVVNSTWHRDSALVLIKRAPFDFVPGEAMIYNNSTFWLLGLVVEKASGMSYEDYVEKQIFTPLGMTRSSYCNANELVPRRAHGYGVRGREIVRAPLNIHRWPFSAGSLCSTAGDMVRWLQALHGGKVLSPRSYAEMIAPSSLSDGTPIRYGMGVAVGPDARGLQRIGHGGAIAGYITEATWYPQEKLAVVVLVNSNGSDPTALAGDLAAAVLPWTRAEMKSFTGDAAPFTGTFRGPARGREMTVVIAPHPQGISASVNGGTATPLNWVDGATFRMGNTYATFRAGVLLWDVGSGLYVLKKQ